MFCKKFLVKTPNGLNWSKLASLFSIPSYSNRTMLHYPTSCINPNFTPVGALLELRYMAPPPCLKLLGMDILNMIRKFYPEILLSASTSEDFPIPIPSHPQQSELFETLESTHIFKSKVSSCLR